MEPNWRRFLGERGACWAEGKAVQPPAHFGDSEAEARALNEAVALLDLTTRGRLSLTGQDRQTFLHGQVTNDVKKLTVGQGCYAALSDARARMVSDLNVFVLADEILLDMEPEAATAVRARLERYIIADDVQVVDVSESYGLISIQGPQASEVLAQWGWPGAMPTGPRQVATSSDEMLGELYLTRLARFGSDGFDLFLPVDSMEVLSEQIESRVIRCGGRWAGWQAMETARVEAGIPRFGADMDEANLVPETGIGGDSISYSKGCYIGQEVIARIRTYGRVAKALKRLKLSVDSDWLPARGQRLLFEGREAGVLTSAVRSKHLGHVVALGYVRKECNGVGTVLGLDTPGGQVAVIVEGDPRVQGLPGQLGA